jgi:hypothetical protein
VSCYLEGGMTSETITCAACFSLSFIGGFADSFSVATMLMRDSRKVRSDGLAASDGELRKEFA